LMLSPSAQRALKRPRDSESLLSFDSLEHI
jgi:hypothetical protein